jgi:hypothetical protein
MTGDKGGDRNKTVWFVTGTSRDLGRALVEAVLDRGQRVAATVRDPAAFADIAVSASTTFRPIRLDVTDLDDVEAAVAPTLETFGRIDVVVNNSWLRPRRNNREGDARTDPPTTRHPPAQRTVGDAGCAPTHATTAIRAHPPDVEHGRPDRPPRRPRHLRIIGGGGLCRVDRCRRVGGRLARATDREFPQMLSDSK